ncbi:AraC family transcriptional regulator [Pontibacter oryzae]|uniref:AraC family transcriptional regulator n=1 Tax=Pontibacter oryzae TaxID=2304593 RepID=A0A399SJZ1_9BACT|nr:AraC family transcriptional regulator [Pontibacter oryzae]RIJ42492.1 AraC family transcriptional regulator [Pontibacter oryzae]
MQPVTTISSVSDMYRLLGLAGPQHPLIAVIHAEDVPTNVEAPSDRFLINLYIIGFKTSGTGKFFYGRNAYDFQDGTLVFTAPGQVLAFDSDHLATPPGAGGWTILFHPDLLRHSSLGRSISDYSFFDYDINEALHVAEKERKMLLELVKNISTEIGQNMDKHSQELIVHNLESILKYSKRYYDRQFYTRSNLNKDYLVRFEQYLKTYFASPELTEKGLPTVQQCGEALHMSGYYLSDLLKAETGKSAKEHIQLYLVDQAKNLLLGSTRSVSEIAYELGFGYPQHFSKLFKAQTGYSPSEYRNLN